MVRLFGTSKVAEFIVGLNGGAQATFSGFRLYSDMLVPIPSMKVAIQGELGSFSHEAAEKLLPRARVVPCARSAEVFDRLEAGQVDAAVIPIENSLAGSVAEHFDLLLTREVFIHREFPLRIRHNLIAPPGVKLERCAPGVLASRGPRPMPQFLSRPP